MFQSEETEESDCTSSSNGQVENHLNKKPKAERIKSYIHPIHQCLFEEPLIVSRWDSYNSEF